MDGFRAGRERVWTVGRHGRYRRGYGGCGDSGAATTDTTAVVMRYVVMVFRARPCQAVRVLIVCERILVARRYHHHGSGEVRLRLMEVIAAAVPGMTLQRVCLLFLVREEFRLEVCTTTEQKRIIYLRIYFIIFKINLLIYFHDCVWDRIF